MSVVVTPAGIDSSIKASNTILMTASFREKLCYPICVVSSTVPSVDIKYSVASSKIVENVVFATIKASITIVSPPRCNCQCKAVTQVFDEYINVSFQNQSCGDGKLDINVKGRIDGPSSVSCGNTCYYRIVDSLSITYKPCLSSTCGYQGKQQSDKD